VETPAEHIIAAWFALSYVVTVPLLVVGRRRVPALLAIFLALNVAGSTIAVIGVTRNKPIHVRGRPE
jgi:hypothetical protein